MIISYDIGTTDLKAALLNEDGGFISIARRPLSMNRNADKGFFEADTDGWKSEFAEVTAELLGSADVKKLRAAVICGNGPTLVPVSAEGEFLNPVMSWMDRRGTEQSARIGRLQEFTIDPTFYLPKAMWIADNLPEVYENTSKFLSCPESMAFWLTGEAVTILPGLRFEKYFWSDELLEKTGMDKSRFPAFVKPGHISGRVTGTGSAYSGLPEGLPVVSAGPDFIMTLIGTAAVYPGRACDRAGTSEGINLCTESYIEDNRLMGYGHVVEPYFNMSGIISTSGKALEWIRRQLGMDGKDYNSLLDTAARSSAGAGGLVFLPYLAGERAPHWDPSARAAFIGLGLQHSQADMVRAVLESTGFAIREVIEVMAENGGSVEELRITGGPSQSRLWNRIKADISGRRLIVSESRESELLGNLVLALRSLGDTDNLAETADRIVRIKEVYEPEPESHRLYSELFEIYKASYRSLSGVFTDLAAFRGP